MLCVVMLNLYLGDNSFLLCPSVTLTIVHISEKEMHLLLVHVGVCVYAHVEMSSH